MLSWKISRDNRRVCIRRCFCLDALLWISCALVLVIGLNMVVRGLIHQSVVEQAAVGVGSPENNNGADIPDESELRQNSLDSYQVSSDSPRVIRIPSLNVEARVLRMGVKANNEMDTPDSIFDTGWYDGSAKPDEVGAMIIDGHASGPMNPGVFAKLKSMSMGDEIQIELGSRRVLTYKVTKVKAVPADKVDMEELFSPSTRGGKGLNLITCTGKFNASTNHYEDRLLVFSEQQ